MLNIQKKMSNAFLALLGLPATAVGFALSTQIAALSWILSNKYHLDIHDVAFVWLAGPIAGIFGQVIVGLLSDNVWFMGGRRRPFIIIGGMVSSIAFLTLPHIRGISHITGISDIILIASVIALFLDLSVNVTFNPARSIIADLTPEGKVRTAGYVWMQIISGFFGVFAYFLSMLFGNEMLLYIAAGIVFLTAVFPILFIQEKKEQEAALSENQEKFGVWQIFQEIFPLYGFLVFGIFSLFFHFFPEALGAWHNPVLIAALLYSVIIGIIIIVQGIKHPSNRNEFQKIMLAHSFTWVAFQSMFILSGFFIENQILPNIGLKGITANWFAEKLTGATQTPASSVGNIVSLGFFILNLIGAIFPLILQSIAKRIGRVRTYIGALIFSVIGYFYIAYFSRVELDFYIGMFLVGIGWSAVISIVFAIMSERVNPAKMGLYMGVFNLAVVLPQMMSNGVANVIKATGNHQLLYIFCGLLVAASVVFWIFVHEPESSAGASATTKNVH
ncbi:major facilitator superfamily MFS_1 [Paludibacter propionicigenes WB4]|uniref:Major facilitator superfamily MFS_1 n=1 Tax=Paludibacter propionicigenes (strain DSM 17365 / JCM 13257 / WB4) TaxID=694427 RepID=E4T3C6_PALPW|nr:MFS transporter [Paludibacter propionicigenes]ADQ79220.1 major facilitator superfamily MFS_1 [Paludibacter propionicigenes WB4]